ncbi:MAG TPA: hypothetical protein VFK61_06140 [Candidatus Limnocylindria bacterium]|nr:hypothetical protein [Candidatus Limnocylindria bacterium]
MTTKKATSVERGSRTRSTRAAASAPARPRHRGHSLAPEHIGEAGSAAVLALAVLGLALFIAGIAMLVFGLTTASRFGSNAPPNVGQLGFGQVLGGIGIGALGVGLVGAALAVLADVRGSRRAAAVLSALAAVLSAIGVLRVMTEGTGDPVLGASLAVATIVFGAAAVILARPPG